MNQVNILIKPASSLCNLRCHYCFYEDISGNRTLPNMGMMSENILKSLVQEAFAAVNPGGRVSFAFQGGEPTLAGLDFFRKFIAMVENSCPTGVFVELAIQTNGTKINDEWASFLKKNRFLVGLSLDGTEELHDMHRVDSSGNGSYRKASHALRLLQKYQVDTNILCVVTGQCALRYKEVYQSLKRMGCRFLQFIPCLDPLENERGSMPFSLKPEAYAHFLCNLFDLWYRDWNNDDYVSIRLFDDYVHLLAGQQPGTCSTIGKCGDYFVIEGDGSVYPCDFYVLDQWQLGNIGEKSLMEMATSPAAITFQEESLQKPQECDGCAWVPICNGGCKRDRLVINGEMQNYYCDSFKEFFTRAGARLKNMALIEKRMMMELQRLEENSK
jgi:uncharacterized protein